ncbi:MAG: hypothetical protein IKV43_00635, partial [Clostridia bacterium]|nr:hypothetical protein [Clostridia bacterium]
IASGRMPTVITVDGNYDVITVGDEGSGYISLLGIKQFVGKIQDNYDTIILSLPATDFLLDLSEIVGFATPVLAISTGDKVDELVAAGKTLESFGATPAAVYYLPL